MDMDKAMTNPAAVFKEPEQVISAADLSPEQKIEILRRWEYDARLLQVADEESMTGPGGDLLRRIRQALHTLGFWPDTEKSAPTKTGADSKR
ncbi:MAG: hypothetical protein ACREQK_04170 [Candidatus Binatia bacterium]